MGCARCHDHKYDPIPTTDYYALGGVFLNTEYHEYPLAPKAVVEEHKAKEKALKKKQELLDEFTATESQQLGETLAFQAAKYMQAAWKVTGEPKKDQRRVVNDDKLDYELFDRWLAFLAKPPVFYPFLKDWQALIARGGTAKEAETLATDFQTLLVSIVLEQREVKKENDIIRARALPTAKPKEPANLPNEFKTNDDFCPGCGLELRSMTMERMALWTDVFRENLDPEARARRAVTSGAAALHRLGPRQRLGDDRRALIDTLRKDIEAMKKALPPKFAYVHGVRDLKTAGDLKVHVRGNPMRLGDPVPRGFVTSLGPGERLTFTSGSGRLELAQAIVAQPIAIRVIVNRVWKEHFGTGLVNTPSNFGLNGERPIAPRAARPSGTLLRRPRATRSRPCTARSCAARVYQLSADAQPAALAKDAGNRLYWRASRKRMSAEQIRDAVLVVSGALDPRARRAVGAADAARRPPHDLRQGEPLQARRVPAVVRLPEPEPDGRTALHHHRAAAAPVLHEQRLHAAARRTAGRAGGRRDRRRGSHREGLSPDLRPRALGRARSPPAASSSRPKR